MKSLRVASLVTGLAALCVSGAAMAGVSVGINLGAPAYVAPAPVYAPPPPAYYQPAPVYAPPPAIIIGWHGDRYWDGRRYWGRQEWYRRHGGPGWHGGGPGWHGGGPGWHGGHDGWRH
ncbi:hypothetical protein [Burkholderia sp. Ac-20379]|uniref:hypothetical protein n=1 Tax=Burkholderia sp. Ac-20379 TaxID=2703900 RepID=UPI001980D7B5|nr:hypothetical protein [Burkholderia sp. Ac-20379]MBN3727846.1 hypothetical protein [Burkholderia sp. Ac-20379]